MTLLEDIIESNPNRKYDWLALSMNPNISFDFIKTNSNFPWVYQAVSRNESITESIVRGNPKFNWSYSDLCSNPNFSFEFFLHDILTKNYTISLNWRALSANPSVTMDVIDQYGSYPWVDRYISSNPNVTMNYIKTSKRIDPITKIAITREWFVSNLSSNRGITERDIYKNVLNWDYNHLSSNPNLPCKYVNDNISKPWNMFSVSKNPNITLSDVLMYRNLKWDVFGISANPNINIDQLLNESFGDDIKFDSKLLIRNKANTINLIENNKSWLMNQYDPLSSTELLRLCSTNPWIDSDWVYQNMKYIDWEMLSSNHFDLTRRD